jgi:exosortase H (IPTLxxWG-CTERM-specific)
MSRGEGVLSPSGRFIVLFAAIAAVGFFLQVLPFVDQNLIVPFIHLMSAAAGGLILIFGGSVEIVGDVLRSPGGFAVRVDNGCSGLEAVILCSAAVLAFPAKLKIRLIGVLACAFAVLGLNVVRIITLFYIGQHSKEWFDWAHLYAWDVLIMADGILAVLLWIRFVVTARPQLAV